MQKQLQYLFRNQSSFDLCLWKGFRQKKANLSFHEYKATLVLLKESQVHVVCHSLSAAAGRCKKYFCTKSPIAALNYDNLHLWKPFVQWKTAMNILFIIIILIVELYQTSVMYSQWWLG